MKEQIMLETLGRKEGSLLLRGWVPRLQRAALLRTPFLLAALFAVALGSCRKEPAAPALDYPALPLLEGPVWPIRLTQGSATMVLADWFGPDFEPDSIQYPPGLMGRWSDGMLGLTTSEDLAPVAALVVWKNGFGYTLPVFRSAKIPVDLTLPAAVSPEGPVQVAGVFNDWNPAAGFMTREGDVWKTSLLLEPGRYPYQFVVGGRWMLDPANPDSMDNNAGGFNSVLSLDRPTSLPFVRPMRIEEQRLVFSVEGEPEGWLLLWEYARLDSSFVQKSGAEWTVTLPAQALAAEESHLTLVAWNAQGRSNDLRVPLRHGKPLGTEPGGTPHQAMTLYFPLVDRFANGDSTNDAPTPDPRILPPANFFGGDLQGLTQQLDYIQALGINTLWVSPVSKNAEGAFQEYPEPRRWFSAYHGYWPTSYHKVDPRFGGDEALDALVREAHRRNMRVLLDFVANHVHRDHPMIVAHPDWQTPLVLPDGTRNLRRWDEHRLTTWFDDFLPTLDYENPVITEAVTDSAMFWIERFNLDGFRHDATKHIPELFWRTLTSKLRQRFPERDLYQIGETFGSRDLIASYLGPGMLDAQFDFPLYFAARSCLTSGEGDFGSLATELQASLDAFGHHHTMGNITGNHDMARFTSIAGGGILQGEDDKEAGWNRVVGVGDPIGYSRMALLMAFQTAIPGLPVVYYGDEIGMPGGGDPDSRRMMRFSGWSPEEQQLHATFSALLKARLNNPALLYGSTQVVRAEKDLLILRRDWFGQSTHVLLNKGPAPLVADVDGLGSVSLDANSFTTR
jgi:glycosidase